MANCDGLKSKVHEFLCAKNSDLGKWFKNASKGKSFSFYTSYDVRESDHKIAPVDANLFPAGYNNICQIDKDQVPDLVAEFIKGSFGDGYVGGNKIVGLLTEEHTKNKYYWDNIYTLNSFLNSAGIKSMILFPGEMETGSEMTLESASGKQVTIRKAMDWINKVDLILSNNDFSKEYPELVDYAAKIHPPYNLGWHKRKKSTFFEHYNRLVTEFSKQCDIDPWKFTIITEDFPAFDVESDESRKKLAAKVDEVIARSEAEYKKRNIDYKPYVVIKNNAGTYGLGVVTAKSGEDVINWSYKARKKMKAAKGGGGITDVIVQEGIPSIIKTEQGETAEPVVYMIGSQLAGGFLRVHGEKGPEDNLNSPGSVYKKLCLSDLKVDHSKVPMENVYGWICRVAALAVANEM